MVSFLEKGPVSVCHGVSYRRIADRPLIDEEMLRNPGGPCMDRIDHDTAERTAGHSATHIYRFVEKCRSVHLKNPVPIGINAGIIHYFLAIVRQSKMH